MRHKQPAAPGFSLTELCVMLIILALLLGGMLLPLAAQQDLKARQETGKALAEIREALLAYAAVNGRLPCPADGHLSGGSGLGRESLAGKVCASAAGVLPWIDLGVAEVDAWGHRYSYRVSRLFAQAVGSTDIPLGCTPPSPPTQAAFALCSTGDMQIATAAAGGVPIAANLVAVVIAHGANGLGAYPREGGRIPGASGEEAANADPATTTF